VPLRCENFSFESRQSASDSLKTQNPKRKTLMRGCVSGASRYDSAIAAADRR
jgi:hypothetical protein